MWLHRLLDFLFPLRSDEEILRATTLDEFLCHVRPTSVSSTTPATTALLPFQGKAVRAALHEAKYQGSSRAFSYLGQALRDYLSEQEALASRPAVLVPIPLGVSRQRKRGFNQAEEVSKRAAVFPVERLLLRTRETASQTALSKEDRRANMRGAFAAITALDPRRLYVLVDDVITTGATMQAAIDALRAGGAVHIEPIALAH